jgi:hypothetical protein
MSTEGSLMHDPRIACALESLQDLIRECYPTATFASFCGEDPEGVYLRVAVDLDDPDEVMDLAIDRLMEYQLEQELPIYLLPVWTDERIAEDIARRTAAGGSSRRH